MPEKNENSTTSNSEVSLEKEINTVTAETGGSSIVQLNGSREIDLHVGVITVFENGVPMKRPAFAAVFKSSAFYRAVCENLADVPMNGFTIDIRQDPKSLSDSVGEKMAKVIDFTSFQSPKYTLLVRTREEQAVQFYNEDLIGLDDKEREVASKTLMNGKTSLPIYQFFKDGFDGDHTKSFVDLARATGWLLIVQDGNHPDERMVWENSSLTYHEGPAGWGAKGSNREARRKRKREEGRH